MRRLRRWARRLLRRTPTPGTVTVTLTADTTAYVASIERVRAALVESGSRARFALRIRRERALGLAYVHQLLDGWRRDLGLEREERGEDPWIPEVVTGRSRVVFLPAVADVRAPTLTEIAEGEQLR